MSDLARYVPTGTVGAHSPATGRRGPSGAASTESVDFSRTVEKWDGLPAAVQALDTGRGDLVAEFVVALQGQARRIDGVLHQEKIAVRAYRQRLIVARMARQLVQRPNGLLAPAGPWTLHDGQVHRPTAASVWQTEPGKGIRPGPTLTGDTISAAGGGERVPRAQETGADTSLYLPASIRDRMNAEVPDPHTWLGTMTQWSTRSGEAARQEVVVLRMNGTRAVVVAADRGRGRDSTQGYTTAEMAGRPWRIVRVRYELGPDPVALPGGGGVRQQIDR